MGNTDSSQKIFLKLESSKETRRKEKLVKRGKM